MSVDVPVIPAWRRLGLKLKNESDIAAPQTHATSANNLDASNATKSPKRPREADDVTGSDRKNKRAKIDRKSTSQVTNSTERSNHERLPDNHTQASAVSSPHTTTGRKKSVSFSEDTKTKNGDSAREIVKQYEAQHLPVDGAASEVSSLNGHASAAEDSTSKRTRKKQKVKKPKSKSKVSSEATKDESTGPPAYLTYLEQFHSDRSNWKFNKVKQTELFKHVFDVTRVPAPYDTALSSYISGLQGQNLRTRLREQSRSVIDKLKDEIAATLGAADMSTPAARQEALVRARDAHIEKLRAADLIEDESEADKAALGDKGDEEKIKREAERQLALNERAKTILLALGLEQELGYPQGSLQRLVDGTANGPSKNATESQTTNAKRKRKARTAAVELSSDSESSESSESESEKSSDGDSDSDSSSSASSAASSSSSASSEASKINQQRKRQKQRAD